MDLLQIGAGIILSAIAVFTAFRLKMLNLSGAVGAFLLGAVVFGVGGVRWATVLLVFFISSSVLSRLFLKRKHLMEEKYAKGARRDAGQVAANGAVAGIMALLWGLLPGNPLPWLLFCAAFAAANADTWATELGVLNPGWPVSARTLKKVPPGTSGGVSLIGTLAAGAGSLLVAITGFLLWPVEVGTEGKLAALLVVTVAGLAGSFIDSLLGATLQAVYWCPACRKETEQSPWHRCGTPTELTKGYRWLNNDVVNGICTLGAVVVTFAGWIMIIE